MILDIIGIILAIYIITSMFWLSMFIAAGRADDHSEKFFEECLKEEEENKNLQS